MDFDIYPTLKKAMQSKYTGAQIYAMRAIGFYAHGLESEELLDVIDDLLTSMDEEDVSVRWEASQTLRKILKEREELTGYILSKLVQSLAKARIKDPDAIIQFLNKSSKDNAQLGQMALSTLTVQLSSADETNDDLIIDAIRQVVRARPELGRELDSVLRSELASGSDSHRANAVRILSTLLEYKYGNVDAIATLIIGSLHDESIEVREEAITALIKSIHNIPERSELILDEVGIVLPEADESMLRMIYTLLDHIVERRPELASKAYSMVQGGFFCKELVSLYGKMTKGVPEEYMNRIIDFLEDSMESDDPKILAEVLDALSYLVENVKGYTNRVHGMIMVNLKNPPEYIKHQVLSLLGEIVIQRKQEAKKTFKFAKKEMGNEDWRIRSAAFSTMIRCLRADPDLQDELTSTITKALADVEPNVRLEVVNYVSELLYQRSEIVEDILKIARDLLKSSERALHSTALILLKSIVEVKPRYSEEIMSIIQNSYEERDPYARAAIIDVLRTCLQKGYRHGIRDKVIAGNITGALKGANNSHLGIRRSAYEAITTICEELPETKHAVRGRKAIEKALKGQEKDPSLLEYLDECRIRALPPRVVHS